MDIYRKLQTECSLKEREEIANFLAINSQKNFLQNLNYTQNLSNLDKDNFNEINMKGFAKAKIDENSSLSKNSVSIINYFKNVSGYNSHVPIYSEKRVRFSEDGNTTNNGYISFDTETVLNCPQIKDSLLQISKNKSIGAYLKCKPKLYSCNTFWTFKKDEKLLTHSWHRDLDDFKFLSVFIFWTKTDEDYGYIKFVEGSHNHSRHEKLLNSCKKDWINKSFDNTYTNFPSCELRDKFYRLNKGVPNGYGHNKLYEKIFQDNIVKLCGPPGSYIICDTFGLHSGSPVLRPRLVTWFRFGLYENLAWHYDKNAVSHKHLDLIENYSADIKDIDFSLLIP